MTIPFAFFYLQGMLTTGDDSLEGDAADTTEEAQETAKYWAIVIYTLPVGIALGIFIRFCTTITKPPPSLIFAYALTAFVMAIMWI